MNAVPRRGGRMPSRLWTIAVIAATLTVAVLVPASKGDSGPAAAPRGVSAISLDGSVGLAWQPSDNATGYDVYRGTTAGAITQKVSPAGFNATSFSDTTAANGTTYYYAVKARSAEGDSSTSQIAQATPRAATCSSGNAIVRENCRPGSTGWKATDSAPYYDGGIEGYASASSVNAGDSVDLHVGVGWDVPYHIDVYRTGWYGGDQGRLVGTIPSLVGQMPPSCAGQGGTDPFGLIDCGEWPTTATLSTTSAWPSGVYVLKLVRDDNGSRGEIPLVVRNDGSNSDVLYHVPTATFQAYNRFGGKSLYTGLSDGPVTVSGANRAVKVDFDRPYTQPGSPSSAHDYYTRTDVATVGWLERNGYDMTYAGSEDIHVHGDQIANHKVFISGSHDEYWSQQMADAAIAARNSGTSLIFMGANAAYWKVRFEASPTTGVANRVMVGYKTIESGPTDPSGISTSTWRDPAGANLPENRFIGQMYVGENLGQNFPLWVSAAQGRNRMWRYTSVNKLADGAKAVIGTGIVGWEWDAPASNGLQPAGLETVASTPVVGNLISGNGAFQSYGNTNQASTIYTAASGARVFSTGTNNWWRGLALNGAGEGEPDGRIQQATANVLSDMGVQPTTPDGTLDTDLPGPPLVTNHTPSGGGADSHASFTLTFDRELDPNSVGAGDLTLTDGDGADVPGTVSMNAAAKTLTFDPTDTLEPSTAYTAHLGTGIKTWTGESPSAPQQWIFSTGVGAPPVVSSRTPTANSFGAPSDTTITAHFDRRLDAATVTATSMTVRPSSGGAAVAATVSYDDATRTAQLTPAQRLSPSTKYRVDITTDVHARDGIPMSAADTWEFTTNANLQVSSKTPSVSAIGISPAAAVRAVFSRPVNASTLHADTFTLRRPDGTLVPAQLSYDDVERTATLTPTDGLDTLTTYTAAVADSVHAADGAPLEGATWTFTTALTPPPAPTLTGVYPADAAVGVSPGTTVRASFDIPLDAATVNGSNVTVTPDGGAPVATTVTYDDVLRKVTVTPLAPLAPNTHYTAALSTSVRSTTGAPLPTTRTWGFTTANCPCNLMTNQQPTWTGPVQDFRPGTGPFSYELGTKITVTSNVQLIALRFYKAAGETGTHVGRLWNSAGAQVASVTFQNETASGWQRQLLSVPVSLSAGSNYTFSVGLNNTYVKTYEGLTTQVVSGPLRTVADGANGVFASTAGQFPTDSYRSSNYFVDGVVKLPGSPSTAPQVTSVSPLSGATGVVRTGTQVTATFNHRLDPQTVRAGTFTLTSPGGTSMPASISYDDDTQTATLTSTSTLDAGTTYTAHLTTGIRSEDETAMAAAVSWSFTTIPPQPPVATQTSPVDQAQDISPFTEVTATFDEAMLASTVTGSSFKLTGPGGAAVSATIDYDPVTHTATLQPIAPLAASTAYTATLTTALKSAAGVAMTAQRTWTFTTSGCPCSMFGNADPQFTFTGLPTANGRGGDGPWSLEMGVKIHVTQPARLEAVRFYKDTLETGSHTARIWTGDGTLVTSVAFTGESASGWQEQALAAPLDLTPGQTYVVSVGINAAFGMRGQVFANEIGQGPLRSVADGQNGAFADAAGAFPTQSWGYSSYGIDAVVR